MFRKRVKSILSGGLGNQLFQLTAGWYLAERLGCELSVEQPSKGYRFWSKSFSGQAFIDGGFGFSHPSSSLLFRFGLLVRRLARGLIFEVSPPGLRSGGPFPQYRSSAVGFDGTLDNLVAPTTLVGYFQTWKYFASIAGSLPTTAFKIVDGTDWFTSGLAQMEKNSILSIHVRRGDYVSETQFGTLSASYYKTAISLLIREGVHWDEIWVFSDDIDQARFELRSVLDEHRNVSYMEPPASSPPQESLILMSKARTIVIANSTFSWWAAILGNEPKIVVCPSKWFRNMEDPKDLYPPNWLQVTSSW